MTVYLRYMVLQLYWDYGTEPSVSIEPLHYNPKATLLNSGAEALRIVQAIEGDLDARDRLTAGLRSELDVISEAF